MQPIAETDLVIVGGGPAGAAAAIAARSYALRVVVLERDVAPRIRPGEAAHPGIEPLLRRLGVMDAVQTADFLRYEGHWSPGAGSRSVSCLSARMSEALGKAFNCGGQISMRSCWTARAGPAH
jgi:2-polyprenyl-6-methoxyphenol hydroxylase-like FAD-dependent oxidoreductase